VPYAGKDFHVDAFRVDFNSTDITYNFELATYALVFNPDPPVASGDCLVDPPVVVEVRDSGRSVVTSATDNITLSQVSGTGTVTGTLVQSAVSGVATFTDIQFTESSVYALDATATDISGTTSTRR
jgi:hypothetical protein